MTWYVRRASLRDQPELETLCRAAAGPDDYVLEHLDHAILREVVHVALDPKERIVGMMDYRPCVDGSGWLAMARTHPDFRRQGVARAIIESFVGMARASNVPFLRMWSEATNAEGKGSASAAGFEEVARFSRVVGPAARGAAKAGPRRFDESLSALVRTSTILARGRGYVSHASYFVPATRAALYVIANLGCFRGWNGSLMTVTDPKPAMPFAFTIWAGRAEDLFEEACRQATAAGRDEASTFIPHDRDLLAQARRAGFQEGSWGREAILFELAVRPGNLRKRVRPTYGELAAARAGHGHAHGNDDALGWARWNG